MAGDGQVMAFKAGRSFGWPAHTPYITTDSYSNMWQRQFDAYKRDYQPVPSPQRFMTPTLHSFLVGDHVYQIIFTHRRASRLSLPSDHNRLESTDLILCEILDDDLNVMAEGRAICSEADAFSVAKGQHLSLARALDEAELTLVDWDRWVSREVILSLYESSPLTVPRYSTGDIVEWDDDQLNFMNQSNTSLAKKILPFVGRAPKPAITVEMPAPAKTFKLVVPPNSPVSFDPEESARQSIEAMVRAEAAKRGMKISSGSLTLEDIARVYQANQKATSLAIPLPASSQEVVDVGPEPETFPRVELTFRMAVAALMVGAGALVPSYNSEEPGFSMNRGNVIQHREHADVVIGAKMQRFCYRVNQNGDLKLIDDYLDTLYGETLGITELPIR